tara:strand:+ start:82 stop:507 length:426 start_codon:yes stop_codon:yes gene_type:complete
MTAISPGRCLCFAIRSASRSITALYDAKLAESGLTNGQFTILRLLAGRGPTRMTELKTICEVQQSTMSREIKLLTGRGLVELAASEDARSKPVKITAQGRRTLRQAETLWDEAHAAMADRLGQSTFDDLLETLADVRRALN